MIQRFLAALILINPAAAQEITVSAAISLQAALEEIGPKFEKANPGARVVFNFGSSGALQQQIQNGAPVDVFVSAAEKQMDALQDRNLIFADTRRVLLTNSLVLIAPAGTDIPRGLTGLGDPAIRHIAIGEPKSVPAGQYALEALAAVGLDLKDRLVFAKDVRQVLTYVEGGNADAGFVYLSDINTRVPVRVVARIPSGSHAPIVYPAAVVRTSANPALARAFLDFLSGPAARSVFVRAGFGNPESP
ncbi:MAG: molybdate ABC transporter substrate-binding protein [Terrimicrobiaceae bacterium]|nr:molybdate ABC transporter substrate-binding protein [Terrimicrobiaceae bacterium]